MPSSDVRHENMNRLINIVLLSTLGLFGVTAMATEEAKYTVVKQQDAFELRDYAPHILAETIVDGTLEDASSKAFNRLFRYISGNNESRNKVAMTSPVSQSPSREKIAMTAPVGQRSVGEKWAVSFMMPASYTMASLPKPNDTSVVLRAIPARRMAAVRYSGLWSEASYKQHKLELETWIKKNNLTITGDPAWARYDPPFTPWFMRRNEILIPVESK
jgi:effector-binding domain-containing protein